MSKTDNRKASKPSGARRKGGRPVAVQVPDGTEPVYGVHSVEALLAKEASTLKVLWVQQGAAEKRLEALVSRAKAQNIQITFCERDQLDACTGGSTHQGVIAFCTPLVAESEQSLLWRLDDWQGDTAPLLLVLDGVTDPHNLGACLRNADAAGADGVIVPKDRSATLNATVRKVACGAAETMPVYQVTNLARALDSLREKGIWVFGMAGEAQVALFETDLTVGCALVMGAEGKGMRRLTREKCDQWVKLPMAGSVSSLNVSVAAGIALFEAVRQRRH